MKKFLVLLLVILLSLSLLTACGDAGYNGGGTGNNGIGLKLNDTIYCQGAKVEASLVSYVITPAGFDFEELNKRGYKMEIYVTYEVKYTKTWNVLWDIGYLGAPKYEVFILDDDLVGKTEKDIVAPSTYQERSIVYRTNVVNLIGSKVYLTFSSDNIQNAINFTNICVKYRCYK